MTNHELIKKRKVQVAFEAISIEGGIFSPEWLSKIAQRQSDYQADTDYHIPKGLNLRDEIGRYYRIAVGLWGDFVKHRDSEKFTFSLLKLCFSFDDIAKITNPLVVDERTYPITHSISNGRIPIVIAQGTEGLDTLNLRFGDERRKRTAFGLIQEYLNSTDEALWGICIDGNSLRILRDNSSLTKPAWVEADLKRIFEEDRYADFAALWLLTHRSRFCDANQPPVESIVEKWRESSRTEGIRAQDKLRTGVENALEILGQGFLVNSANGNLKEALHSGKLTVHEYYQELLRTIYKLIFLLTIEERNLLHPEGTPEDIKLLYLDGYSLKRLRAKSIKRSSYDRFFDLWESLKITFKGLNHGEKYLGLPALGGLFSEAQSPHIDQSNIENRFFLNAIYRLSWIKEDGGVSRINWRDMGPEELGSVYESLLELVPQVRENGTIFTFVHGEESRGNARKLTGSYYTPDSLVQSLLDTALEPVVSQTIKNNQADPVTALLKLSIIDPACGSGHFLLAAARRMAAHVARLQIDGTPTASDYRKALRTVIGKCIYGVDKNPMAIELARTALWLEAMTPDAPLGFLDHHLVCGDSLLGLMDLSILKKGIPNEAYKPLTGDDKEICKNLSSINGSALKQLKKNTQDPSQVELSISANDAISILQKIEEMPDSTYQEVEIKKIAMENYISASTNLNLHPLRVAADLYVTAFICPKNSETEKYVPTTSDVLRALGGALPDLDKMNFSYNVTNVNRVLHWKIIFAHIFAKGGFDVILGNPPWEKVKLQEREWFASRVPEIANAQTAAIRAREINELEQTSPIIYREYLHANRQSESDSLFVSKSLRFPMGAAGDTNTYPLFVELSLQMTSPKGRLGIIIKTGLLSDYSLREMFAYIIDTQRFISGFDFSNKNLLFPSVVANERFTLLTVGGSNTNSNEFKVAILCESVEDIKQKDKCWSLTSEDIRLINPNTHTCPLFQTHGDAIITLKSYRRIPVLIKENGNRQDNAWGTRYFTMFHMTNDSGLFRDMETLQGCSKELEPCAKWKVDDGEYVSLLEGKLFDQFDHRHGDFRGISRSTRFGVKAEPNHPSDIEKTNPSLICLPRYWVNINNVYEKYNDVLGYIPSGVLVFRDVCRTHTDLRTVRSTICPPRGAGNKAPLLIFPNCTPEQHAEKSILLCSNLNSFALDYIARQKFSGGSLNRYILIQLPIIPPEAYELQMETENISLKNKIITLTLKLIFTSYELEEFARTCGYTGSVFSWNREERLLIRSEIDAIFFQLYGFSADEVSYILDTFPILKRQEEKEFGVYRSKQLIMNALDRLGHINVEFKRDGVRT